MENNRCEFIKNISLAAGIMAIPGVADDYTAYSDIVSISPTEIGILYERDNYSEIVFKVIKWR